MSLSLYHYRYLSKTLLRHFLTVDWNCNTVLYTVSVYTEPLDLFYDKIMFDIIIMHSCRHVVNMTCYPIVTLSWCHYNIVIVSR
jgi:hypothetical protein